MRVLSADAGGQIDGTLARNLLGHLPDLGPSVSLVVVSYFPNYSFNPELNDLKPPIIVLDYMEPHAEVDLYRVFNEWVGSRQQAGEINLTLRRELKLSEVSDKLKPVDWPCHVEIPPTQSKEAFDARPFFAFYEWGYSHASRPRLHGDIFHGLAERGISVLSHWDQINNRPDGMGEAWVSIYSPHWARVPIERVMKVRQQSKISVSLFGNGKKCFRTAEAPAGSIMAMPQSDLAFSYPWEDGHNCILLDPDSLITNLYAARDLSFLYDIYVNSQETIRKYRAAEYASNYVTKAIQSVL